MIDPLHVPADGTADPAPLTDAELSAIERRLRTGPCTSLGCILEFAHGGDHYVGAMVLDSHNVQMRAADTFFLLREVRRLNHVVAAHKDAVWAIDPTATVLVALVAGQGLRALTIGDTQTSHRITGTKVSPAEIVQMWKVRVEEILEALASYAPKRHSKPSSPAKEPADG